MNDIDEGYGKFIGIVYLYVFLGIACTGIVAHYFAATEQYKILLSADGGISLIGWIAILSPLAFILMTGLIRKMPLWLLNILYFLITGVLGISLSIILLAYSVESIAMVFFITSGVFGIMSIIGLVTKRDLSSWGQFLLILLLGLIVSMLGNLFLKLPMLDTLISLAAVIIFAILMIYDANKIKKIYRRQQEDIMKGAIMCAISLYLDFLNFFLQLLKLIGKK